MFYYVTCLKSEYICINEDGNHFTPVTIVVSSGVGGRGELSLAEVQCHLDKEGASDLVIDLIMNATSDRIFQESILLAIALLEGGNTVIQVSGGYWVVEYTAQTMKRRVGGKC